MDVLAELARGYVVQLAPAGAVETLEEVAESVAAPAAALGLSPAAALVAVVVVAYAAYVAVTALANALMLALLLLAWRAFRRAVASPGLWLVAAVFAATLAVSRQGGEGWDLWAWLARWYIGEGER